jgi:amino-acid N-acetyltransferase
MISYCNAGIEDMAVVIRLLEINQLPFSDINAGVVTFMVAKKDNTLIGCIGLERHGDHGLLRSFAVVDGFRNQGIGRVLYNGILKYALQFHIKSLHLLTNTAAEYFTKQGFVISDRKNAPYEITETDEFKKLCPASSTYMVLKTIELYAD